MSSVLGSAASLSRSAGGLSAGLQERNRYWIQFLEWRIADVEGKMRASGELERVRDLSANNGIALPAAFGGELRADGATSAATPAGAAWGWQGFTNGANHSAAEGE